MVENEKLKRDWKALHKELVQKIVDWVKDHDLKDVDLVNLQADCLDVSVKFGSWHPGTDSCLELYRYPESLDNSGRSEEPFLISV